MIIQFPIRHCPSLKALEEVEVNPNNTSCEYLSTEEVARKLGYATRTITLWANEYVETGGTEGIPGGKKIGKRQWRFERRVIEAWIANDCKLPLPLLSTATGATAAITDLRRNKTA